LEKSFPLKLLRAGVQRCPMDVGADKQTLAAATLFAAANP
jgi:hypothetical protein